MPLTEQRDPTIHVLLIEDDAKVALSLRKGLLEAGFQVTVARTAAEAESKIADQANQVILLDLGLPDRDGIDLLREIREQRISTPVLILTARDTIDDRVLGLEMGADDYLPKPFSFSELLARIRALVRRAGKNEGAILRVDDLEIDLLNRHVRRGDRVLDLTPREFDLLAYLANQVGMTVSREALVRDVWHFQSRSSSMDNVIDVHIARLRDKLDRGFEHRLLQTVRGVGFKVRAPS